jgi:hypothetical protein
MVMCVPGASYIPFEVACFRWHRVTAWAGRGRAQRPELEGPMLRTRQAPLGGYGRLRPRGVVVVSSHNATDG